jgi:hypothetical protein
MIIPLLLRGELYALFKSSLDYPVRATAFDWLMMWVRLSRLRAGKSIALFEMVTVGRLEQGPDAQGLLEVLGNTRIFRMLPAPDFGPGFFVDLGPGEGLTEYLEDRVARYQRVLKACAEIGSVADPMERDLRVGQRLYNEGLYFDCHEYLETAWNQAEGPEKDMIQGVIQAGAAFHKWELGSQEGCTELLRKAIEKLTRVEEIEGKEDLFRDFVNQLGNVVDRISRGNFDMTKIPKMAVFKD